MELTGTREEYWDEEREKLWQYEPSAKFSTAGLISPEIIQEFLLAV